MKESDVIAFQYTPKNGIELDIEITALGEHTMGGKSGMSFDPDFRNLK